MRQRRIVISFSLTLVLVLLMNADRANAQFEAPSFTTKDKMTLTISEYEARSKWDFTERPPESDFEIKLKAMVKLPDDMDLVCITEKIEPKSVVDAKKLNLLKPPARPTLPNRARDNYNAFLGGVAPVDLDRAEYRANPYLIATMTVEAWVLVAKERKEAKIAAKVVEDPVDIGNGMKVRLSAMKINNQRDVDLTIEFTRPEGTGGTILEAVYALDDKGNELGGGRWGKGLRIFEGQGKFTGQFSISGAANIHGFKCVMVTKHELRPVQFEIEGVFQK